MTNKNALQIPNAVNGWNISQAYLSKGNTGHCYHEIRALIQYKDAVLLV